MDYSYYGNYGNTYGYDSYNTIGTLSGAYIAGLIIGSLIAGIFAIIVMWKLFKKAGKPGWAAIVPFYNIYTMFDITWGKGWMCLTLLLAIIPIIGYIAVFIITIMTMIKLAKAFGKDTGFAVGLIFLSIIFMAILAFDSSEYLGVPTKDGSAPTPQPAPTPTQPNTAPTTNFDAQNVVSQPQPTPNQNTTFCPNCGTQLQPGTQFCQNCGNKITN